MQTLSATIRTSAYRKQASDGRWRRCSDDGKMAMTVHARLQTSTLNITSTTTPHHDRHISQSVSQSTNHSIK